MLQGRRVHHGRPTSYSSDLCELAHNYCLLGGQGGVGARAGRRGPAGGGARCRRREQAACRRLSSRIGVLDCTPLVRQQNNGQRVDH
jgi:hypothetical protein